MPAPVPEEPSAPAPIGEAIEALRRGDADTAVRIARRFVMDKPKSPVGHEVLGAALALKRSFPEAERELEESLKLESALAKLRTARRVAVLHYSPIRETVEGEPSEIFPFLGSSRLEEPLLRYPVTVVLHGHAHHGQPEGRTRDQAPVYNVCLPLLLKAAPDRPPFRLIDLDRVPG